MRGEGNQNKLTELSKAPLWHDAVEILPREPGRGVQGGSLGSTWGRLLGASTR